MVALTPATLTASSDGATVIDGRTLELGDVVLLKDQADATENGVWVLTTEGATGVEAVFTRHSDFSTREQLALSPEVIVQAGTTNANSKWLVEANVGSSDDIIFNDFSFSGGGGAGLVDGDYGDITVGGTGTTMTIDNGVVSLAKMADMATASFIYRATAGTGVPQVTSLATVKTALGLTGTNSGDQTITLTGNVTGSGTGSFATTIAASAVTLAMHADMATASVFYRKTAGSGAPEVQTLATLKTDLGLTGTNSGDQSSIVGISGTIAQFNTACSDADFCTGGVAVSGSNTGDQTITLTGSVTGSGTGSFATTIVPNVQAVSSSATVTPTFSNDLVKITAQAAALDLLNPTGSAVAGKKLVIRIKDNGTPRAITYNTGSGSQYRAIGVTLPTTTVTSKVTYLGMIYNSDETKWDVIAVAQEA